MVLAARRALVQRRLLAGVVALVAAGATLLGVCALLLTATQGRAFTRGVQRTSPADLEVTAFLVEVASHDAPAARDAARGVITAALAPLGSTTTTSAVSSMRELGGADRLAYLGSTDDLDAVARLTSGRRPRPVAAGAPVEAVVPGTTARLLHLQPGSTVTLGRETGGTAGRGPLRVVVVGVVRPTSSPEWQRDPLSGKGFDPAYSDGSPPSAAYGPFLVDPAALLATGSTFDSLRITGRPGTAHATQREVAAVVDAVGRADARLTGALGDRVRISRVASDLPQTLGRVRAQQTATRSTVLVVVLLGTTIAAAALLLAGRLVAVVRADERVLLSSLGADRRQLLLPAAVEALVLAGVAALVAGPVAAVAHSTLTHLPALAAAGLAQGPTVTGRLVLAVGAAALVLTAALVVPTVLAAPAGDRRTGTRAGATVRSGLDLLLLALAVASWWQLTSQPSGSTSSVDAVRVVAPVLGVAALAVVAVRGVPPLLGLGQGPAVRSRSLLLPLAVVQAARRPHAVTASVLLAVAAGAGTFGLSLRSTWERSQLDQAAVRVGTDLAVTLTAPPTDDEAVAVARAAGGVVSPVTSRPVALGRFVGDQGAAPQLVAVDARRAGPLLRGRLDGDRTWAQVGALLAPPDAVTGVPLAPGGVADLTATAPPGADVRVTPTGVVQDASGLRTTVTAGPVPADGAAHRLRWRTAVPAGAQLVALDVVLSGDPDAPPPVVTAPAAVDVVLAVPRSPASTTTTSAGWTVRRVADLPGAALPSTVTVRGAGRTTAVRVSVPVSLADLAYVDTEVLATAFEAPQVVPVAVSEQLAHEVGATVGGGFTVSVAGADVPVRVVAVVPTLPSVPGRLAVLADADTLSRTLVASGRLEPVVDAWWVGHPAPGAAAGLRRLGLGDVTSLGEEADRLAQGPLRVTVPAVLLVLVVACVVLLLAGTSLLMLAELQTRAVEIARLRALGLTRREVLALLVTQHGVVLGLLVVVGALVGAAAALALGPSLVRSDVGVAPDPAARVVWPVAGETALVVGLVAGCVAVTALVAAVQVRRTDTAHLRVGDA